jgi:hypothetical protein
MKERQKVEVNKRVLITIKSKIGFLVLGIKLLLEIG